MAVKDVVREISQGHQNAPMKVDLIKTRKSPDGSSQAPSTQLASTCAGLSRADQQFSKAGSYCMCSEDLPGYKTGYNLVKSSEKTLKQTIWRRVRIPLCPPDLVE